MPNPRPRCLPFVWIAMALAAAASAPCHAQLFDPLARPAPTAPDPLTSPTLSPGAIELMKVDAQFAADVLKNGGSAFSAWMAPDAVTLSNGKPAVFGQTAIAATAHWAPAAYQLTWKADGAQMGPSGDSGFTWGEYTSTSHDRNGQPVTLGGRYITVWKKTGGHWKVALEASADAPANDCCSLPHP